MKMKPISTAISNRIQNIAQTADRLYVSTQINVIGAASTRTMGRNIRIEDVELRGIGIIHFSEEFIVRDVPLYATKNQQSRSCLEASTHTDDVENAGKLSVRR